MNARQDFKQEVVIIDSDLNGVNQVIEQLDTVIQDTGNLELSKTLNDISDSYQAIRALLISNLQS